jgi:hypothetical protein
MQQRPMKPQQKQPHQPVRPEQSQTERLGDRHRPSQTSEKPPTDRFAWLHSHPGRIYLIVAALLLLFHIVIFRDVIAAIPDVLRGDASIVREELVPFFDFSTQFWGEGTSALTSSEEVRVNYSFWTAWVRHDKILPFALVLLNTLSAFILFYAFHRLGRYIYKHSLFGIIAALLATLLIHTILLYSKIAHFYVLIIGFSMFALSLSLLFEQLFFKIRLSMKNVLSVSALTLFNPAIHYHVIFYVVALLIIIIHSALVLVLNRKAYWKYFWRGARYFGLLVLLSLVPYIIFIFATSGSSITGVSTQIPVNYWMIYYSSLALPFVFSLDTAGHIDLIRYGNYLAPIPRFGSMVVIFLIGSIFVFKRWHDVHIVIKVFIITLFIVMLFAMWMTIGYSENSPYSFHDLFGSTAIFFSQLGGIGEAIASLFGTFINVLRFPHRFQFIYFYVAGLLFMIALVWLRGVFMRRRRMVTASLFVILIALFPLYANNDYRTALTSGDLASFAAPYYIPQDLKDIKQQLADQENTKLFILPTLESGRELVQDDKTYSFLDKYLIYYTDKPTYYYGAGANTENKLISYLVYRAIAYDEPWWEDVLADTLGITNLLVPVQSKQRAQGMEYLPGIDEKIRSSLAKSTRYEKTSGGEDFELFSLKTPRDVSFSLLIDTRWQTALDRLGARDINGYASFFPLQMRSYLASSGGKKIMTDSVERTYYDLYAFKHAKQTSIPNPASLPFDPEYVASSNFTNNTLSLSILYAKDDEYNYLHENVPSLVNLQRPSFVGLTKGQSSLPLKIPAKENGKYRLLLHAASKQHTVHASIGGKDVELRKIKDDQVKTGDYVDFSYFYVDLELEAGIHTLALKNTTANAVLVDSALLMPAGDLPTDFTQPSSDKISITPTDQQLIYDLKME